MGNIGNMVRADVLRDGAKPRKINLPRIRGDARNDDPWLMFAGKSLNARVVDAPGLRVNAVLHRVPRLPGEIYFVAVGKMPAGGKPHAKERIPPPVPSWLRRAGDFHEGGVDLEVRGRAGIRLHVRGPLPGRKAEYL